jgi:hypothetical protein
MMRGTDGDWFDLIRGLWIALSLSSLGRGLNFKGFASFKRTDGICTPI